MSHPKKGKVSIKMKNKGGMEDTISDTDVVSKPENKRPREESSSSTEYREQDNNLSSEMQVFPVIIKIIQKEDGSKIELLIKYKSIEAKVKHTILQLKRKTWRLYSENKLNRFTPIKLVWNTLNAISGKFSKNKDYILQDENNDLLWDSSNKANLFAKKFLAKRENLPDLTPAEKEIIQCKITNLMMEVDSNDTEFTEEELERVIQSLPSNKSPEMDGVTYDIIKILGPTSRELLLRLYNTCLNTGKVPTTWSTSVIIPILKPGKPPLNPDNYRPISLTGSFIKIMEHMIKSRIESVFDKTLINEQVGFRKRRCTMDAIVTLETDVKTATWSKSCVEAVFFDLSSVLDSIPWDVIMTKVSDSVKGKTLRLIYVLLQTEKAYVKSCDKFSNSFRFNRGVPQGGVLSPILFNLCMSDFPLDNVKGEIFADDIAVRATDSSPHGAFIKIKKSS
ncbi:hypothetical protein QYM36_019631 [Artemia franciscana]|uniref:Reverse transcriptase domain-containing protein n=1 Tax=Artemia franciscana TaxID=6661 RepID=A0AA88KZ69_ARTSF|nr:hypothetical protein QYM36_019631 [Artemia franciscana]